VHVAALRRKLAGIDVISTLRGVGYRFDAPA
jgi:DNA-binding response OmpR family regulator